MSSSAAYSAWSRAQSPLSSAGLDLVVQKHLQRVYSSLLSACVAAAAGCALQLYLGWNAGPLTMLLLFGTVLYFGTLPQHSPRRPAAFLACAVAQGWSLGPLLNLAFQVAPATPLFALVGAGAVFASLSISAMFAKRRSYLFLGGFCSSALSLMSILTIARYLFRGSMAMDTYLAMQIYGGLLVFAGYVLFDTQVIIEKAHAGERDYLKHALTLFVDLVAIFVRVLIILIRNHERKEEDERRKERN